MSFIVHLFDNTMDIIACSFYLLMHQFQNKEFLIFNPKQVINCYYKKGKALN